MEPQVRKQQMQTARTEAKMADARHDEARRKWWARKWRELATLNELAGAPKYLREE